MGSRKSCITAFVVIANYPQHNRSIGLPALAYVSACNFGFRVAGKTRFWQPEMLSPARLRRGIDYNRFNV